VFDGVAFFGLYGVLREFPGFRLLLELAWNNSAAPFNGNFQLPMPCSHHRRSCLRSNNGSGDIRDPVVAKRDLAALGPLLLVLLLSMMGFVPIIGLLMIIWRSGYVAKQTPGHTAHP
jgi:hypothetical protein